VSDALDLIPWNAAAFLTRRPAFNEARRAAHQGNHLAAVAMDFMHSAQSLAVERSNFHPAELG
jgi:hypothetical protein